MRRDHAGRAVRPAAYALGLPTVLLAIGAGATAHAEPIVLDPNGPVGAEIEALFETAVALMAIVVVPVLVLTPVFAWRYRASREATYRPEWHFSRRLEAAIWLVPAAIIAALGYLVWTRTHMLDPYAQAAPGEVLEIEAIALDWKWVFIYPEQEVATVNELVVPAGRPFRVALTADTVMNAFYVPGLGGQIFAMSGMRTEMNLMAEDPAHMWGRNMQFTGEAFPDQRFPVRVTGPGAFEAWLARARATDRRLDYETYAELAAEEAAAPVTRYASVAPGLFRCVIASYEGSACLDG